MPRTKKIPNPNPESRIVGTHKDAVYNFEQMREVWYLGMVAGATIWQICQDNKTGDVSTVDNFNKVMRELFDTVKSEQALKDVSTSQALLIGVCAEILKLDTIE